jgi:hypothetical protein
MKWIKNLFGLGDSINDKLLDEKVVNETKNSSVKYGSAVDSETENSSLKYGFPVDEEKFEPRKIGRMDLRIVVNGEKKILTINELIKLFDKKIIIGSESVVITRSGYESTYFCGEGRAIDIINSWKSAALDHNDVDLPDRVNEYGFQISINTKYELMLFNELYSRVSKYFHHVGGKNKVYKQFRKQEMKDLVLLLDGRNPGWDDDEIKCYDELDKLIKIFHPDKIRTLAEQKEKKRLIKLKSIEAEVNLPVVRVRNALTAFPHKEFIVEIKDIGKMEVRKIKPLISSGAVGPDTMIRCREENEWLELSDFLEDWAANKISVSQMKFLKDLYRENSIIDEIPCDLSRQLASEKIDFLFKKRNSLNS